MAKKTFNIRIQSRMDTESNWTTVNSLILPGERVISIQVDGSLRAKVNSGAVEARYNTLEFEDKFVVDNVDAMSQAVTNLQGTVGGLQSQIGAVSNKVNGYDTRISDVEKKNTDQDSTIGTMRSDLDAMSGSVSTMEGTVGTLQGQVAGYSGAIGTLQNQVGSLNTVTQGLQTDMGNKANLASPTFTGTPKAPTPAGASNDTTIATTAFVKTAMSGVSGGTLIKLSQTQPSGMKTGDIWLKQL